MKIQWITGVTILLAILIWMIIGIGFYLSPQDDLEKSDVIVVISGGETDARTREGVDLFYLGYAPRIIFSGAARDQKISGISNAEMMADIASHLGLSRAKMILEEKSETTYENAQEIEKIMQKNDWQSMILVTSPYHQKRALFTFKRVLGREFKIINRSATDSTWRKNGWWKSADGWYLSMNEMQKILYLYTTGNYE